MSNTVTVTTPSDLEIVISRRVDAPRAMVWEAMNKPELLKQWLLGPPGWEMAVCENDLRVGGSFRHLWRQEDGAELAMHGEYREVAPLERTVRTVVFDIGCEPQSHGQVVTMELTELEGTTTVTITVVYPSKEARDGMLASGMEQGVAASYDRLEALITSTHG